MKLGVYIAGLFIAAATGCFGSLLFIQEKQTGYVRTMHLYENYKLTEQYEQQLTMLTNTRNQTLDSLEREAQDTPKSEQQVKLKELQQLGLSYQQEAESLAQTYRSTIFGHINQAVTEYAQMNSYDMILGANGDGTIMYAASSQDLSVEILEYMNGGFVPQKEQSFQNPKSQPGS